MSWGRELWDRWGFAWWLYYLWFCTIMCICPFSLLSNPRVHYCPIPTLHHHHHWHTYGDDLILNTFNRHEAVAEENSKAAAHLGSTYARFPHLHLDFIIQRYLCHLVASLYPHVQIFFFMIPEKLCPHSKSSRISKHTLNEQHHLQPSLCKGSCGYTERVLVTTCIPAQ